MLSERNIPNDRHTFQERFRISKGLLEINFKVIENALDKNPYCFGYHPYLKIDD